MPYVSGTHRVQRTIGRLILSIALTEFIIMLLFTAFRLERFLSPLMLDVADAVLLSIASSILIYYGVVNPLYRVEARFRKLLESNPDGLLIVNSRKEIIMANDSMQELTGYSRKELINQPIGTLMPEEVAAALEQWEQETDRAPKAQVFGDRSDIYCMRKDGTRFRAEVKLSPLATEEGYLAVTTIENITERQRTLDSLRLAQAVFENTTEGIVVTNTSGDVQSVNQAFVAITGFTEADALGRNMRFLKSGMHDAAFYGELWKSLRETGAWKGKIWNRRKNGEVYPQETTINAIRNESGVVMQYCCIFRDVTVQTHMEDQLRMLSTTDGLTGLANRRTFDEVIQIEWRRAQRVHYPIALILADIDNFKMYNDSYGHLEGDDCLKKVGSTFKHAVRRAGDLAARYGGEELALILPMTTAEEAVQIAEDIRRKIGGMQLPHETNKPTCVVTASFGAAALTPQHDMSPEDLILHADKALYEAKHQGKNRVIRAHSHGNA